jgi:hypothetical protein
MSMRKGGRGRGLASSLVHNHLQQAFATARLARARRFVLPQPSGSQGLSSNNTIATSSFGQQQPSISQDLTPDMASQKRKQEADDEEAQERSMKRLS